jgi:hypothetical protein
MPRVTGVEWDIALVAAMDHPGSEDVIETPLVR